MKHKKLLLGLGIAATILVAIFLFIGLNANNFDYALSRRIPKIIAMILVGISIGFSSLVFQTITNNRILTQFLSNNKSFLKFSIILRF